MSFIDIVPTRKAIDFDLRVADLKQYYGTNYTYAYKEIETFFLKYGFEHDQGSGYISNNKLERDDIIGIIYNLCKANPWFIKCVDDLRYTSILESYDGMAIIDELKNETSNLNEMDVDDDLDESISL